jgi:hypothetical protein
VASDGQTVRRVERDSPGPLEPDDAGEAHLGSLLVEAAAQLAHLATIPGPFADP